MVASKKNCFIIKLIPIFLLVFICPFLTGWKQVGPSITTTPHYHNAQNITNKQKSNFALLFAGMPEKHYEIRSTDDWLRFAWSVNNGIDYDGYTIVLENDLDFAGITPIVAGTIWNPFRGVFDGNNHTIKNYTLSSDEDYVGIFGYTSGAEIKNLIIEEASIYGIDSSGTGGIAGCAFLGSITDCTFSGQVSSTTGSLGGIAGSNRATIANCTVTGEISGGGGGSFYFPDGVRIVFGTGGIVGDNEDTLYKCTNRAQVSSEGGGIAGYNQGTIASSVNYGTAYGGVSATTTDSSWLNYCFNLGECTAGIANYADFGCRIEHCHNLANVSGRYKAGLVSSWSNGSYTSYGAIKDCMYLNNGGVKAVYSNDCQGTLEECNPIKINNEQLNHIKGLLSSEQFIETEQYLKRITKERNRRFSYIFVIVMLVVVIVIFVMIWSKKQLEIKKAQIFAAENDYSKALDTLCRLTPSPSVNMLAENYLKKHLETCERSGVYVFGRFEDKKSISWDLLEAGDSLVLISKESLSPEPVNSTFEDTFWDKSSLYHALNSYYKTIWFNKYESKFIIGEITILSIEEAQKYYSTSTSRKCKCIDEEKNGLSLRGYSAWWLRPTDQVSATKYPFVTFEGAISTQGMNVDSNSITVRPVIRLRRSDE